VRVQTDAKIAAQQQFWLDEFLREKYTTISITNSR
jgi:hypothetical protein